MTTQKCHTLVVVNWRWWLVRAQIILGTNLVSLAYVNFRDLTPISNALFMWKINFEKKFGTINQEISISCTTQECLILQRLIIQLSPYYLSSGH